MGAGNSKAADGTSQHVFTADTPVHFSNELVQNLQKSPESDSTRSKTLELQIQSRVTSELERLNREASSALQSLQEKLTSSDDNTSSSTDSFHDDSSSNNEQSSSLAEKLSNALSSPSALAEKQRQQNMSSDFVSKEVEELRKKLAGRKKLEQVDENVGKAKDELVACLRGNDRRPLDCWREVEAFRREVGRLEREFVERTVR